MSNIPNKTKPVIVGALVLAGLSLAPAQALAAPQQQQQSQERHFSAWILGSLCQEGVPSGDSANSFGCTMPDGSSWTCRPSYSGYVCTREGAAGTSAPTDVELPDVTTGTTTKWTAQLR